MQDALSDSLLTPARSATYQIQTDTSTTVREKTTRNSITLSLRQTYYGPANNGTDAVLVELLDFHQTDQSPLSVLLADLNPVNNRLVFDVSAYGDLLTVRNLEQVEEQWRQLRPQILHKYGRTREGLAFIDGFGQQLRSDTLVVNLRHKGAYGVLFPGLFGRRGAVRTGVSDRRLTGFFGTVDLPLLLHTEVQPDAQVPGGRHLHVTGQLDADRFDEPGLHRLVREAVGLLNFRVTHRINCQEDYHLDAGGWLRAARQELTFTIENFYYQHTQHELKRIDDGQ